MPIGIYNHKSPSDETRLKMSLSHKGVKRPKSVCNKISLAKMGNKFGKANKGKKHTDETRKKFSESHKGEKSSLWKGGISGVNGYKTHHARMKRARKVGAIGEFTIDDWEKLKIKYKFTCPCCGKREPEIKLSADHIMPISKGGSNKISNIQPLCVNCNSKKSAKTIRFDTIRSKWYK